MKWQEGRQGTGYYKLKLFESKLLKLDVYLLKFPENSYISPHTDPSTLGYQHHRMNVILKKAIKGGEFKKSYKRKEEYGRVIKFRPDIEEHFVSKIKKGSRWVLSVGWLKRC